MKVQGNPMPSNETPALLYCRLATSAVFRSPTTLGSQQRVERGGRDRQGESSAYSYEEDHNTFVAFT